MQCSTMVSIAAFGPGDPGSNPCWFAVSNYQVFGISPCDWIVHQYGLFAQCHFKACEDTQEGMEVVLLYIISKVVGGS